MKTVVHVMKHYLKCPSSILRRPCDLISYCRDPTKAVELQEVLASASQQSPLPLDVANDESVAKLTQSLQVENCTV